MGSQRGWFFVDVTIAASCVMAGLVLELQSDALNAKTPVSGLLRKALVISKKLGIAEIEQWIRNELGGYPEAVDIPKYREVHGEVEAFNPYQGWRPVHFGDPEFGEALSRRRINQPVGELDVLLSEKDGFLIVPFSHEMQNRLMEGMNLPLHSRLRISKTEVVGILEEVRTNILQWALELEHNGITGEGMTFTKKEKDTANSVTYNTINNIGLMHNSQLQQHSNGSAQSVCLGNDLELLGELIDTLKSHIDSINLAHSEHEEYKAEISTLESQLSSPKPKKTIISESLKSLRTILEGAAGNLLASELLSKIAPIMQLYC